METKDPYYTLPQTITTDYAPPLSVGDPRPKIIRASYPNDRRIELYVLHRESWREGQTTTDVWVWDTQNPGHGRWLMIERK